MTFPYPDTMPPLSLNVPKQTEVSGVELNESLLRHWITRLPNNNLTLFTQMYLDALERINKNQLDQKQRLRLLDIYRKPLNQLLFQLSTHKLIGHIPNFKQRTQIISDLTQVMLELATGYKIIIAEANHKHTNLKLNPTAQLAINRACEQLSFVVLHAYKFYRTPPARVLHELHQLYQLVATSSVEDLLPIVESDLKATVSFRQLYSQLMLVSICNPYGLHHGKVLDAYKLMYGLAVNADILPLPPTTKPTAGHFYINCLSDRIPIPSVIPMAENQTQPPALIFNTKPILSQVDNLFQEAKKTPSSDIDINLLKQLAPFLNTSYERKQARVPVEGNKEAYLAFGLDIAHRCLSITESLPTAVEPSLNSPWQILNKNRSGYLVSQNINSTLAQTVFIGDFVAIFEPNQPGKKSLVQVGFVRWMRIDKQDVMKMGLSLIEGDVVPVSYSTDNNSVVQQGLFLPEIARIQQAASLITSQNDYAPKTNVIIRPKKKRFEFTMITDCLLSQGNNYQHFTLKEPAA